MPDPTAEITAGRAEGSLTEPAVSIVVITRGPSLRLARLLRSLGRATGIEQAELLLGLNGVRSVVSIRELAWRLVPSTPLHVVPLPRAWPAGARNELLPRVTAPVILFLDDDVEVPVDLLVSTRQVMSDESVDVAGGPNLTPPTTSEFEQLVGRVLASPVGSGPVRHRYRLHAAGAASGRNLMLCNLAVRRSSLGGAEFDAALRCAEENELLARLAKAGAMVVSDPRLAVYHRRRETLKSHFRQMGKYGFGRGQMVVRAPSLRQLPYALPTLALLTLPALGLLWWPALAGLLLAYFIGVFAASALVASAKKAPTAFGLFVATHVGYAVGLGAGTLRELTRRLAREVRQGRRSENTRDVAGTLMALAVAVGAGSVAGLVLARALGPAGRGEFELARSLALTIAIAGGFGLGRAAVFYRGRGEISQAGLFGTVTAAFASGLALGALTATVLVASGWHGLDGVEIALACSSIPLIAFYTQAQASLRGIGQEVWFRRLLALRDTTFLALLAITLAIGVSARLALTVWTLQWLLGTLAVGVILLRSCGFPAAPARAVKRLTIFGASQVLLAVLTQLHLRLDLFVLRGFKGSAQVGQYAVASGLNDILTYGGMAIGLVLFPLTVRSSATDPGGGRERTRKAIGVAFSLTLAGGLLLAAVGPRVIVILVGEDFAGAGSPLRALLPGAVAMALVFVIQSDLAGRGRIWTLVLVEALALAANAASAVVLIPAFGTTGAAASFSITHVAEALALLMIFVRATRDPSGAASASLGPSDTAV